MTPEQLAASLIADVPRYSCGKHGYQDDQNGTLVQIADVLAALAAAVPADLAEAGKVLEGVTPGPWHVGQGDRVPFVAGGGFARADLIGPESDRLANARFIAWCREGVPALLARIAAQEAQINGLMNGTGAASQMALDYMARAEAAETALAAERAKVAKLVEVERAARKLGENLGVKGVDVGSLRVDLYRALAAITEAGPTEYERKVAQMKQDFPNGI